MPSKKFSSKAVWAVAAAVIVVVALLIVFFISQNPSVEEESIVLPTVQDTPQTELNTDPDDTEAEGEQTFFEVSNENVLMALNSLNRPIAYYQTYMLTVGSDDAQTVRTAKLWVNGSFIHAEVSSEQETKCMISDGSTAYLWYADSPDVISVQLEDGLTSEDLLGLPGFIAYLQLSEDSVVDSDYLVLEDPQIQCIYVCAQENADITTRYWVNLENGLLYQADVLENSNQVYTLRQTSFEMLAQEDESFIDRFLLPDGSSPFKAAKAVPQP